MSPNFDVGDAPSDDSDSFVVLISNSPSSASVSVIHLRRADCFFSRFLTVPYKLWWFHL